MKRNGSLLFFYAETPLHPGTGAHLGSVDLPVQRERHTGYPVLPGSSLKGVFRAEARASGAADDAVVKVLFGPDTKNASDHPGALAFTEGRILLFPLRALGAVFAYATSCEVLARFQRDLGLAGIEPAGFEIPEPPGEEKVLVTSKAGMEVDGKVVLEEFAYGAAKSVALDAVAAWVSIHAFPKGKAYDFWRRKLARDLVVLPDDEFRDFTRNATEIVTRVRLEEDSKTVSNGALWTEEHVPSDAVFYSLVLSSKPAAEEAGEKGMESAEEALAAFANLGLTRLQVGGDETVGRGFVALRVAGGN